jgi:hypothetical protein
MPLMWLKCLILILKMAWAKLISFLNGLISKISQNKPVKPVKFFSSFPDARPAIRPPTTAHRNTGRSWRRRKPVRNRATWSWNPG